MYFSLIKCIKITLNFMTNFKKIKFNLENFNQVLLDSLI